MKKTIFIAAVFGALWMPFPLFTYAQEPAADENAAAAELAKKLQNPIADLISVPIQHNWDFGIGKAQAHKHTINIQPVIPISIHKDWNVITRTIMPVTYLESTAPGGEDEYGFGDIVQSFFFSPKEPVKGWVMGGGPVFLYPSSTNDVPLGTEKFGLGPTIVLLQQRNGWTYGVLPNHIWSVAGNSDRKEVNATFIQPFLSYTTKKFTTFAANTESTYDWEGEQWTVPINGQVSQLLKIGKLPVSLTFGGGYYVQSPSGGPEWKVRFMLTFLFPKK